MKTQSLLLEKAKHYLQTKDNKAAIQAAHDSLTLEKSFTAYNLLSVSYIREQDLDSSILYSKLGLDFLKTLKPSPETQEQTLKLNLCLSKAYKKLNKIEESKKILKEMHEAFPNKDFLSKYLLELSKSEELKDFEAKNKFKQIQPNQKFFIISKTWYDKWYKFHSNQTEETPGNLSNSDIIEKLPKDFICFDAWPETKYLLKLGLKDEIDFKVLTEPAYQVLKKSFDVDFEIARSSYQVSEHECLVEIFYPIRKLLVLGVDDEYSDVSFAVSKNLSVSEIKQGIEDFMIDKIHIDYSEKDSVVWKLPESSGQTKLDCNMKTIYLPDASLLSDSKTLEENKVAPTDILILEYQKYTDEWTIKKSQPQKCEFCGGTENLQSCSKCKKVKYCGTACQINDLKFHKSKCSTQPVNLPITRGRTGLQNLGNTCFMNSGLQCLAHCKPITQFFLSGQYKEDLNYDNPLGTKGAQLAIKYAELIKEMWTGYSSSVSPWEFKSCLSRFASQFSGYHQHDSQEFLSFLLSGLHEDLNRIKKKQYIELPEQGEKPDSEYADLMWDLFLKRNQSIIVDHMYGQLKSTVICPICGKKSNTFDPFLTLSASLVAGESIILNIYVYRSDFQEKTKSFKVEVGKSTRFALVREKLEGKIGCKLKAYSVVKLAFARFVEDDEMIGDLPGVYIVCVECPDNDDYIAIPVNLKRLETGYNISSMSFTLPRLIYVKKSSDSLSIFEKLKEIFSKSFKDSNRPLPETYEDLEKEATFKIKLCKKRALCPLCKTKCEGCYLSLSSSLSILDLHKQISPISPVGIVLDIEVARTIQVTSFNLPAETFSMSLIVKRSNLDINHCLEMAKFPEILDEDNKWYCSACKEHVRASKELNVYKFPDILVVHLLRFKKKGYWTEKNTEFVDFPVNGLVVDSILEKGVEFNLFAISNHYGGTGGGHYTAFIKSEDNWYEMDDGRVSLAGEDRIVTSSAYLLFYERVR